MGRKLLYLLLAGILILPMAQSQVVLQKPKYFVPRKIFVIGRGIITDTEDPLEFEPVKIFVGKLVIYVPEVDDWVDTDAGILKIGNKTYKLVPITLGNKTFEANVIEKETKEILGRIYVRYVVKYWQGLWVGDLELNNKSYYVYVIEEKRVISPRPFLAGVPRRLLRRIREKLGEVLNFSRKVAVCIRNPRFPGCKQVFEECLERDTYLCRAFVNVYCKVVGDERCPKRGREVIREIMRRLKERWRKKHKGTAENETAEETSGTITNETVPEGTNETGGIVGQNTSVPEANESMMGGGE